MARVWYVGTYPYREITPQDWDELGVFGPHFQWSADNGWSVDQDNFRPAHLAYLAEDPEFLLNQEGVRPDTPMPPDDVTRPYKADASILKLVDDAFEALDLAESALEDIQTSVTSASNSATQSGTYRNEAQTFRNEAETFKNTAGTSASTATTKAATATTKAGEASVSAVAAETARTGAQQARDAAEDHATAAGQSASDAAQSSSDAAGHANRAEEAVDSFGLSATSSTLAPGAPATVTVSGEGPAYTLAFGVPKGDKGDKGDEGTVSQTQLDAAVASLVNNAPEALNTLDELSMALGDDPNFATTVATQIGERAKTSDVNAALASKADTGHKHPVSDIVATGSAGSNTFLEGNGKWTQLPKTEVSKALAEEGTNPYTGLWSALRVRQAANAAIAANEWYGTQAQYDSITTKDPNRTYNILEG